MSMYHTKTPDENGWYWVKLRYGEIGLCRFDPEDGVDDTIWMMNTAAMSAFQLAAGDVAAWIGPLPCPFGEFGDSCTYFNESQYASAIEMGEALVVTVVDGIGSDRNFGTVASHYQMPLDEALDRTGGMMRMIDRNPE